MYQLGFEKLKGYSNYYKKRFGNYRIGAKYEDDTLILSRILHRKDIYRFFHKQQTQQTPSYLA